MFKLYWWCIALGIGASIMWATNVDFASLCAAWVASTFIYISDPETILEGKFDGGFT